MSTKSCRFWKFAIFGNLLHIGDHVNQKLPFLEFCKFNFTMVVVFVTVRFGNNYNLQFANNNYYSEAS